MLNFFLALWLAFACPANQINANDTGQTITTNESGPGDNGHVPPPPPPPPGTHY